MIDVEVEVRHGDLTIGQVRDDIERAANLKANTIPGVSAQGTRTYSFSLELKQK